MKLAHLQARSPRAEELNSIVIGTRVILSQPKSQDDDVHTDPGSSQAERKESPASNIKRLQRHSLAIVKSEENRIFVKEEHTSSSPKYAGFIPQTPQRFEGKFGANALADTNFAGMTGQASVSDNPGRGTENLEPEDRNSLFLIESTNGIKEATRGNTKQPNALKPIDFGRRSNEFAQLNEGDKALLDIDGSPRMVH